MKIRVFPGIKSLISGIFFFGLVFVIHWIEKDNREPIQLARKFEKILCEKQYLAKEILHMKMSRIEKGFTVFMFKNDSLIFWSDNTIPLPVNFNHQKISEGPTILRLKNGWYSVQGKQNGNYSLFVLILIKQEYPFENDYLKNRFPGDFGIPPEVNVSLAKGEVPIFFPDGRYALSLSFPLKTVVSVEISSLFLLFFLLGFLFIIMFLFYSYERLSTRFQWKYLLVAGITIDVIFIRGLQFFFKFPAFLYQTDLFGPAYYSSSVFLPSLGDLIINSTLLLALSYIYFLKWTDFSEILPASKIKRSIKFFLTFFLVISGFFGIIFFIDDFIINSTIPLNLQNILSLIPYSGYGLYIIWATWASFFLLFWKPVTNVLKGCLPGIKPLINLRICVFSVILFSVISMILINKSNDNKEKESRKILALKLATKRNPVTETLFSQIEKQILTDTTVLKITGVTAKKTDSLTDKTLEVYLRETYFKDYWNKFNIQITLCAVSKNLQVQPQGYLINCDEYFHTIIKEFGESTSEKMLYFLDYGYGKENYLAMICLPAIKDEGQKAPTSIYIELNSKYVFKDLGYPELLVDHNLIDIPDISEYSYAFFQRGTMLYSVGKFQFAHSLQQYKDFIQTEPFFNFSGTNHYYCRLNESGVLLISKKNQNFLTTLSPFAYLFIYFGLASFFLYMILQYSLFQTVSFKTLRDRLQISMIGMLFLSFLTLGAVIVVYIIRLNNEKNDDYLRERALSVQMELQYKFGSSDNGFLENHSILENQLIKMSNIFFSDINIYDNNGKLVASSRPQVFNEGLISDRIDSYAFNQLKTGNHSLYIHEENIGKHYYCSAYLPFYNNNNDLSGYINLPYFTRQDDLKKEISTFLVAFINIYVLLFILGVFFAFILSKYIASPLRLLAGKMGGFKLGERNERIEWRGKDEIGKLVEQYNKMVEELEESAEKLAISEREGAWREMARQVAHEIKNPLTPMKLNVQHLLNAWNDNAPGWDHRLNRFSHTITEQIDALALIATEFSDFAQMPVPVNENLDLAEVLQTAVFLYKDLTNVNLGSRIPEKQAIIWADRKQLLRVFTNLFNNAVEAIGNNPQGYIKINIEKENENYFVLIKDNGRGIPADQTDRIFQPNFTTKSGGMGLGLAIVKAILKGMNGTIQVESEEGQGATFILKIPVYQECNLKNG